MVGHALVLAHYFAYLLICRGWRKEVIVDAIPQNLRSPTQDGADLKAFWSLHLCYSIALKMEKSTRKRPDPVTGQHVNDFLHRLDDVDLVAPTPGASRSVSSAPSIAASSSWSRAAGPSGS